MGLDFSLVLHYSFVLLLARRHRPTVTPVLAVGETVAEVSRPDPVLWPAGWLRGLALDRQVAVLLDTKVVPTSRWWT